MRVLFQLFHFKYFKWFTPILYARRELYFAYVYARKMYIP